MSALFSNGLEKSAGDIKTLRINGTHNSTSFSDSRDRIDSGDRIDSDLFSSGPKHLELHSV